jgi:hypothetical protein
MKKATALYSSHETCLKVLLKHQHMLLNEILFQNLSLSAKSFEELVPANTFEER